MIRASPADWDILRFLDAPVWFGRRHLAPLLALVVPARIVAVVPSTVGQALTWGVGADEAGPRMWLGLALTYGGMVFSMLILTGMFAALTHAVVHRMHGRTPRVEDSWRFALRPAVLGTTVLIGGLTMVGSAMCLLPGLLAAMYLSLALPVMVQEGRLGGAALDRSVELARHGKGGAWFTSTGAFALCLSFSYAMLSYAITSLVTLPAAGIGAAVGIRAAASGAPVQDAMALLPGSLAVVLNLGSAVLSGFADIYVVAAVVLLYQRAVDLLEGVDLCRALEPGAEPGSPA